MKSIIVEGVDGMGKTYLARQLSRYYDADYAPCGPPPKTEFGLIAWTLRQAAQIQKGDTILDRATPISRYVYSKLFGFKVSETALENMAHALILHDPIIIYCYTHAQKHAIEEYDSPSKIKFILDNTDELHHHYLTLFDKLGVMPLVYDWTVHGTFGYLTNKIKEKDNEPFSQTLY